MDTLKDFLANPSRENWAAIVRIGRRCANKPNWHQFSAAVLAALPSWPKEMQRTFPEGIGPPEFREQVENRIRETDTYGHYIQRICGDPRLALDGKQRVWLERRFTGGVVPASSAKQVIATLLEAVKTTNWGAVREAISVLAGSIRNTGKTGTADLTGGLILKHPSRHTQKGTSLTSEGTLSVDPLLVPGLTSPGTSESQGKTEKGYLEIRLEIEVKIGTGTQRPEQIARERSVRSRGGLYLLVRSVEEAVQGILLFVAENE